MILNNLVKSTGATNFVIQSVRHNCPWHRSNFRPFYFPFHMNQKLKTGSFEARQKTYGGRLMIMRRVLREQPFLGWNHDARVKNQKLQTPL
uniref:Uncharacterized protein n=1 Tax=Strongyloides papillosus TaxID=174720 RepID=A0A0N5CHF8_STREA